METENAVCESTNGTNYTALGGKHKVRSWRHGFKVLHQSLELYNILVIWNVIHYSELSPFWLWGNVRSILFFSSVANAIRRVCIAEVPTVGK